jgi:hypothetical protein
LQPDSLVQYVPLTCHGTTLVHKVSFWVQKFLWTPIRQGRLDAETAKTAQNAEKAKNTKNAERAKKAKNAENTVYVETAKNTKHAENS